MTFVRKHHGSLTNNTLNYIFAFSVSVRTNVQKIIINVLNSREPLSCFVPNKESISIGKTIYMAFKHKAMNGNGNGKLEWMIMNESNQREWLSLTLQWLCLLNENENIISKNLNIISKPLCNWFSYHTVTLQILSHN